MDLYGWDLYGRLLQKFVLNPVGSKLPGRFVSINVRVQIA